MLHQRVQILKPKISQICLRTHFKMKSLKRDAMTPVIQQPVSIYRFFFLTSHHILVENAKIFKEEFLKRNVKTQQGILNLQSMRLGINSVIALSNKIGHGGKKVSLSRVS